MSIEDDAKEAVGNWRSFSDFGWSRQYDIDDLDNWAIFYTHNRDSRLLEECNANAINEAMELFTDGDDPDVVMESHRHWAVGHVDGFSMRIFRNGEIIEAFKTYHELMERLEDYPILDEEAYSNREYEATIENIGDASYGIKDEYELPEGWESEVFSWFWDHRQRAVENRDDQGGYPDHDDLRAAFDALGYAQTEE
jgi:hypothetical protein